MSNFSKANSAGALLQPAPNRNVPQPVSSPRQQMPNGQVPTTSGRAEAQQQQLPGGPVPAPRPPVSPRGASGMPVPHPQQMNR